MEALAGGGTFALVGMGADCCPAFPMSTLVAKEADFRGCFRYTNIVSSFDLTLLLSCPSHIHDVLGQEQYNGTQQEHLVLLIHVTCFDYWYHEYRSLHPGKHRIPRFQVKCY